MWLKFSINKDIVTKKHVAVVPGLHLLIKLQLRQKYLEKGLDPPPRIPFASLSSLIKGSSTQYP